MDTENRKLSHKLKNVEQEKLVLRKAVRDAADELDELADADCDDEAIEKAGKQASRLRRIADAGD